MHGSCFVGVDGSVLEAADTGQFGIIADLDVLDTTAVEDAHVGAYISMVGSLLLSVRFDLSLQLLDHLRPMTVEGEDICETCAQFVEDRNLPSASFVHDRYTHSVSERAGTIDEDSVDVLDTGVVADIVVGDVVMDIIEVRLVAHFAVM